MTTRDERVMKVFLDLPGHRGCSNDELDQFEKSAGVVLPVRYREFMALDSTRLVNAGIVVPFQRMVELKAEAEMLLNEVGSDYRLSSDELVFAWDEIYSFYFFKAEGSEDPPVMMFNYNDSGHNWEPVVVTDSLTAFVASKLGHYLRVD